LHKIKYYIFYILFPFSLLSQKSECQFIVKGKVLDSLKQSPLFNTEIQIVGINSSKVFTDDNGEFILTNVCIGNYELHVHHHDCEHLDIKLSVNKDTQLIIYLNHSAHEYKKVTIHIKNNSNSKFKPNINTINQGNSIAELMENINGVQLLKTGSNISKPIVNGLSGQRVIMIHNGVRLEGQNWGLEHAPEIEPSQINEILLLKGSETLKHANDGIGGVIISQLSDLFSIQSPFISAGTSFSTNNRMISQNFGFGNLTKNKNPWYYRTHASIKKSGNVKTSEYFLDNTGQQEWNVMAQVGKEFNKLKTNISYTQYNNKTGLYSGAQIGNLTDLYNQFNNQNPPTFNQFSYQINRSFQEVKHTTIAHKTIYQFNTMEKMELNYNFQKNHRQEYDRLRSNNSYIGADFNYYLSTHALELNYSKKQFHQVSLYSGFQLSYQQNAFDGRFFIPGFVQKSLGAYVVADRKFKHLDLDLGYRYDIKTMHVYLWKQNSLREIQKAFDGHSFNLGTKKQLNKKTSSSMNLSHQWRAPAPNELFSNGLHQSSARLEIGDSSLNKEINNQISFFIDFKNKNFEFQTELYYQQISNFIQISPSLPAALTIRGAYPVFKYQNYQTNIAGNNSFMKYKLSKLFTMESKFQYLIAYRQKLDEYLPFIPPMNINNSLIIQLKNVEITLAHQYVAEQKRYEINSDYIAPPKAYNLINFTCASHFNIKKQKIKCQFSIFNLTNTKYRNYLNMTRYFNDEQGITFYIKLTTKINKS